MFRLFYRYTYGYTRVSLQYLRDVGRYRYILFELTLCKSRASSDFLLYLLVHKAVLHIPNRIRVHSIKYLLYT